jgi:hypothetical protein
VKNNYKAKFLTSSILKKNKLINIILEKKKRYYRKKKVIYCESEKKVRKSKKKKVIHCGKEEEEKVQKKKLKKNMKKIKIYIVNYYYN